MKTHHAVPDGQLPLLAGLYGARAPELPAIVAVTSPKEPTIFEQMKENFCTVFGRLLKLINNEDSASLGDRAQYIGASDIGKCPRQVVLGKLQKTTHTVRELIRFVRGHVTETVVNRVLEVSGAFYTTQVEVIHPNYPFILAHIDCILHDGPTLEESTTMVVKEMKSPKEVPDEPYDNQIMQVYYQLGLLKLKYPNVDISGHIFNLSVADGEYLDFGAYTPNDAVFASLVEKAKKLMECVRDGKEPECEVGLLCGFCHYKQGCPPFMSDKPPLPDELVAAIAEYDMLRAEKKCIEHKMEKIKEEVVAYTGNYYKNPVGSLVLKVSKAADSFTLDGSLLKTTCPDIWERFKKPKSGSVKMEVL
jgi:CRISPR-associated exonuclease Cas4